MALFVEKTRDLQPFLRDGGTNYVMGTVQCSPISQDKIEAFKYYWMTQFHHSKRAYELMEYIQISGIQTLITNLRQEILFYKLFPKQNQIASLDVGKGSKPVVRRTRKDVLGGRKPQKLTLFGSNLQNPFILYLGLMGGSILIFVCEHSKSTREVFIDNAKIVRIGFKKILQIFVDIFSRIFCYLLMDEVASISEARMSRKSRCNLNLCFSIYFR